MREEVIFCITGITLVFIIAASILLNNLMSEPEDHSPKQLPNGTSCYYFTGGLDKEDTWKCVDKNGVELP